MFRPVFGGRLDNSSREAIEHVWQIRGAQAQSGPLIYKQKAQGRLRLERLKLCNFLPLYAYTRH